MSGPPIPLSLMGDQLTSLKVPELKMISRAMGLSNSGRKQDLIDRIVQKCMSFEVHRTSNTLPSAQFNYLKAQIDAAYHEMERLLRPILHQHPLAPENNRVAIMKTHYQRQVAPNNAWGMIPSVNLNHQMPQPIPFPRPNPVLEISVGPAPELDGARCLCPVKASRGSGVSKCVNCPRRIHSKCHQTQMVEEWHCEYCRSELYEPFFQVQSLIMHSHFIRLSGIKRQQMIYEITDHDLLTVKQRRGDKPGCLELQLRCFATKESLAEGHCWPTCSTITVNGFNAQLVQRAVPGQTNTSKVLRELPLNLLQFTRPGRNVINISTAETLPNVYVFLVQTVIRQDLESLVNVVVENSKHITYEQARDEVIKSFGDKDDDIVATVTMLSLRCPLGLCVINLPVRGIKCQHLQCFDLKTFLMFNRSARSRAWKCIVCHKFIALGELRIDPYLKKLLSDVADDEELEEVEIYPDATWKKRMVEDEYDKKPKIDAPPPETITPIDHMTSLPLEIPLAPTQNYDSIDLTLSSDEEDDRPLIELVPPPQEDIQTIWPIQSAQDTSIRPLPIPQGTIPPSSWGVGTTSIPPPFGGILDESYDEAWGHDPNQVMGRMNNTLPPSSVYNNLPNPVPPVSTSNSTFPFTPLTQFIGTSNGITPSNSPGPTPWPQTHGLPAKPRKRLLRGDELRDISNSNSHSTMNSITSRPMSMADVIYLDTDSD